MVITLPRLGASLVQRLTRVCSHRLEIGIPIFECPLQWAGERLEAFAPFLDLFQAPRGGWLGPVHAEELDAVAGRGDMQVPAE